MQSAQISTVRIAIMGCTLIVLITIGLFMGQKKEVPAAPATVPPQPEQKALDASMNGVPQGEINQGTVHPLFLEYQETMKAIQEKVSAGTMTNEEAQKAIQEAMKKLPPPPVTPPPPSATTATPPPTTINPTAPVAQ